MVISSGDKYTHSTVLSLPTITLQVNQSELDMDLVKTILGEYRIHNADITLRYDASTEDLIDVIEGNRVYLPCIYVLNKIDQISIEVRVADILQCLHQRSFTHNMVVWELGHLKNTLHNCLWRTKLDTPRNIQN